MLLSFQRSVRAQPLGRMETPKTEPIFRDQVRKSSTRCRGTRRQDQHGSCCSLLRRSGDADSRSRARALPQGRSAGDTSRPSSRGKPWCEERAHQFRRGEVRSLLPRAWWHARCRRRDEDRNNHQHGSSSSRNYYRPIAQLITAAASQGGGRAPAVKDGESMASFPTPTRMWTVRPAIAARAAALGVNTVVHL